MFTNAGGFFAGGGASVDIILYNSRADMCFLSIFPAATSSPCDWGDLLFVLEFCVRLPSSGLITTIYGIVQKHILLSWKLCFKK